MKASELRELYVESFERNYGVLVDAFLQLQMDNIRENIGAGRCALVDTGDKRVTEQLVKSLTADEYIVEPGRDGGFWVRWDKRRSLWGFTF